jgi:hypothetical protein
MEGMLLAAGASRGVLVLQSMEESKEWKVELEATFTQQKGANVHESDERMGGTEGSPDACANNPVPQRLSTSSEFGSASSHSSSSSGSNSTNSGSLSASTGLPRSCLSFLSPSQCLDIGSAMPLRLFHYVLQSCEPLALSDAFLLPTESVFHSVGRDPYFVEQAHRPRCVLAVPVLKGGNVIGVLYLENDQHAGAFSSAHIRLLQLLCSQSALSLDNSRLYARLQSSHAKLESQVRERTSELQIRNQQLEQEITARVEVQRQMTLATNHKNEVRQGERIEKQKSV